MVDEGDIGVATMRNDESTTQEVRGHKTLATPAVRRIAMENSVRQEGGQEDNYIIILG